MKSKIVVMFAACVAASVLNSSCSNEENTANSGQFTAFTGGIVTESPMTRVQLGTSESSTVAPGSLTRTSMDRPAIGGKGVFFWEAGDVIYVQDDNSKLFKSQSNITDKTARNTFFLSGVYGGNSVYNVYYYGTPSGSDPMKVVIAADQKQTAFNNTKHFGASGDCGVAKAEKNTDPGKGGYKFDLEHKASYLCFLPYISSQSERESNKIQSIEVTSNNNIAGTYDLSPTGLSGEGNSKTITLHAGADGLLLADNAVSTQSIMNSLYMVIAPGSHIIKVKYTLLDTRANKSFTVTKTYGTRTLAANTIYDIPVNLSASASDGGHKETNASVTLEESSIYDGHNYYMWGAKKNYWFGHEWDSTEPWQGVPNKPSKYTDKYPKSKEEDPDRWFNDITSRYMIPLFTTDFFNSLPTLNELSWYILKGNAYLDSETRWEASGMRGSFGLWIKKLSVIAKENNKNLAELKNVGFNGEDLLERHDVSTFKKLTIDPQKGKPNNSEIDKYFYLPALGYYYKDALYQSYYTGYYWSSSFNPNSAIAYCLVFDSNRLYCKLEQRNHGCIAYPFE